MSSLHYNYNHNNLYRNVNERQNYLRNNDFHFIDSNYYPQEQEYLFNYENENYGYKNHDFFQQRKNDNQRNYKFKYNYNELNYHENISQENRNNFLQNNNINLIANTAQTNMNPYKKNLNKGNNEKKRIEETNKSSPNPNLDLKKQVLKALIYIYYYEKDLSKKNIFNNEEKYYLINTNWFKEFKNFYLYDVYKEILESLKTDIYYIDIDSQINIIIDILFKKYQMDYKPFVTEENICTGFSKNKKNITFTSPGTLIPSRIMNIIKKLNTNISSIKPKKFRFENNFLYYIKNKEKKIIIGLFRNSAKFVSTYILSYTSPELEKNEEEKIISLNINEYVKLYNCNLDNEDQDLVDEIGQKIGDFYINKASLNQTKQGGNKKKSKTIPKDLHDKQINNNRNLGVDIKHVKTENKLNNNDNNNNLNKPLFNLKEDAQNKYNQIQDNKLIKEQLQKLKNVNKLLLEDINKKNILIQNLNNDVNKLNNQNINISNQLKEKEKKTQNINKLLEKNKELKEQNDNLKNQISQIEEERGKLKEKFDGIKTQFLNQQELINKNNILNSQLNDLKQELKQKNDQIKANNSIKDEFIKLRNEKISLINSNNEKEIELKKLKSKLEVQINNNKAIKSKEKEIEKMKKEFEIKQTSSNNLMEKYNRLEKQNVTLNNNNNELKIQIKNLIKKNYQNKKIYLIRIIY